MKFKTQLTAKDIFKFSLIYTYFGASGISAAFVILVGVFMCIRAVVNGLETSYTSMVMGILLILLFAVVNPVMLYVKAKKQVLTNPVYQKPSYYTIKEEGIFVEVGEETGTIEWERILKIRHAMGLYILYTGRQQAFVFPEDAMGDGKEETAHFIEEHVEAAKRHLKKEGKKKKTEPSGISKYAKAETHEDEES